MSAADYVGIAGLITSTGAVAVSIIIAFRQDGIRGQVEEVHTAVSTPNGATIGEIVAGNDPAGVQDHA